MRIGLVLPAVPAYSETFFVNKIKGLHSRGYEVVLFIHAKTPLSSFEGAPIRNAPSWSTNPIKRIIRFFRLFIFHFKAVQQFYRLEQKDQSSFFIILKKMFLNSHLLSESLDWIHFGFGTMALERENIAQAIGAKMAVSFRGFDIAIYPLKRPNCYKKLWKKVNKIHVISEDIKDLVINNGCKNPEKIIKITPAIDCRLFSNSTINQSTSKLRMVTIARLNWKKGLEYTLEALAFLKQNGIDFHFTIVGDGIEKERLQFAVHQLGLVSEITFTGKLTPNAVKETLEQGDIYLQYSIQEGFCNAVLEAQAMGKLCIVSDAEGLTENVIDNVTGFVVPKRNPISLAKKILEVSKMTLLEKEAVTQNAMERIKKEFTIEKQQKEFLAFYENY